MKFLETDYSPNRFVEQFKEFAHAHLEKKTRKGKPSSKDEELQLVSKTHPPKQHPSDRFTSCLRLLVIESHDVDYWR
jgi:hypothetical protein